MICCVNYVDFNFSPMLQLLLFWMSSIRNTDWHVSITLCFVYIISYSMLANSWTILYWYNTSYSKSLFILIHCYMQSIKTKGSFDFWLLQCWWSMNLNWNFQPPVKSWLPIQYTVMFLNTEQKNLWNHVGPCSLLSFWLIFLTLEKL